MTSNHTTMSNILETITPALVEQYLKSNTRNRTPNQGIVTMLTNAILHGKWKVNGDAIRFGADNTLYDGQHRLMAICKAGVPVQTHVVRGLAPEARDVIDLGGIADHEQDLLGHGSTL